MKAGEVPISGLPPAARSKTGGQKRYAQSEPDVRPRGEKILGAQPKSQIKKEAFGDLATIPWDGLKRSQRRALKFGLEKSEGMGQIGLAPKDFKKKQLCAQVCGVELADMPNDAEEIRGLYRTIVYSASRRLGRGVICDSSLVGNLGLRVEEKDGESFWVYDAAITVGAQLRIPMDRGVSFAE